MSDDDRARRLVENVNRELSGSAIDWAMTKRGMGLHHAQDCLQDALLCFYLDARKAVDEYEVNARPYFYNAMKYAVCRRRLHDGRLKRDESRHESCERQRTDGREDLDWYVRAKKGRAISELSILLDDVSFLSARQRLVFDTLKAMVDEGWEVLGGAAGGPGVGGTRKHSYLDELARRCGLSYHNTQVTLCAVRNRIRDRAIALGHRGLDGRVMTDRILRDSTYRLGVA